MQAMQERSLTVRRYPRPRYAGFPRLLVGVCLSVALLVAIATAGAAETVEETEPLKNISGPIKLMLPPVLYAVPGVETNVYFDNVVLAINPKNYAFDVVCPRGVQQAERWTYTPAAKEVGECPFQLDVLNNQNELIARGLSTLQILPADAGSDRPLSMLIIGDSLTAASAYPQRLIDLCKAPGNPKLRLIGSFGPNRGQNLGENRHEGYGGWTAQRFATHYSEHARTGEYRKRGSPFLYKEAGSTAKSDAAKLDFARYLKEYNGGSPPDVVTIFLGCNDTFSSTDETIDERIDVMFTHLDTLIGMIHGVSSETRIGLLLLVPPAATQDAFGANYRTSQTRWQYKRNQHRVVERTLKKYGARDGLFLIPTQVNLDCLHNYPSVEVKCNAHCETTMTRLSNGVHPNTAGYKQIGDSVYAWLKSQLAR